MFRAEIGPTHTRTVVHAFVHEIGARSDRLSELERKKTSLDLCTDNI